ncbi:MAG: hypothetical protein V4702_01765 [Patescibacteria group bacterium]
MKKLFKIPMLTIVIIILVVVSLCVGYLTGKANAPTVNTPNPTPANNVTNSNPGTNSNPPIDNKFPGFNPPPVNLNDCLEKVNNLDASAEIVQSFRAKCYQVYQ